MKKDLADTCLRYLDGDLAADELQAFGQLLVQSPEAADLLAQLALDEQHYRATPGEAEGDLLPELLKLEEAALPLPQGIPAYDDMNEVVERSDSYRDTLSILSDTGFWGYVVGSAMRSKPVKWAAAAAVVLLAATLVFVFTSGEEDPSSPLAGQDTGPAVPAATLNTPSRPTVATLTATHNAQWSSDSAGGASALPVPGTKLHPNDRLTLTAGFAEITTSRGAVAIIEAPATVELLDSSNALRLHAGKLVGICETESSKGFLVRTPHMDVTDLGTRFGVDASATGLTVVHVFEGEVSVAGLTHAATNDRRVERLVSGQSVRATAAPDSLVLIEPETDRFSAIGPEITQLPGTGQGLANKDTDPNWQIVAIDGEALDTPLSLAVFDQPAQYNKQFPNDPGSSQWLSVPAPKPQGPNGATYVFRTQLELPDAFQPDASRLIGRFMVDFEVTAIRVNGQSIPVPSQAPSEENWYLREYQFIVQGQLRPGSNAVEFDVKNDNAGQLQRVGFRLAWALHTNLSDTPINLP